MLIERKQYGSSCNWPDAVVYSYMIKLNATIANVKYDLEVEVEGVDMRDYPDFCDAYLTYVRIGGGEELNEVQLDKFNDERMDIVNEAAHKSLF